MPTLTASHYTLAAWPTEPAPLHWAHPTRDPLPTVASAAPPSLPARPPQDERVRAMVAELAALAAEAAP